MGDEKEELNETTTPPAPPAEEVKGSEADVKQPDLAPLHEGEKETPSAA